MQAEIISIGDEILIGQITDTNSKWISHKLNEIGIHVYQITSVQDKKEHILKALAQAEENADIILLTGGLGPTKDDITKHTLAGYFEDELVFEESVYKHIRDLFSRINITPTKFDRQQAMLPNKAKILKNDIGTASGMWFEKEDKIFVSMPGVPAEMKGLMRKEVLPRFKDKYHLPYIIHKTILTYGMNESNVARLLEDWEDKLPDFIKLAYLPSYEKLRLRFTARGADKDFLIASIDREIEKLHSLLGDTLIGVEERERIEVILNRLLTQNKLSLSTAESCTGGNIARTLTSVAGASAFFTGSVVAYSAKVKREILGVSKDTIDKFSVVSEQVAKEMALKCRELFQTDYAIATTGNAGPTTDITDKTVGTVFVAIACIEGVKVEEFNFGQPREKVILRATGKALEMLKKEIDKNNKNSL